MTIFSRILRDEPRPSEGSDGMGCGTLIVVIVAWVIFGFVTWRMINWLAWL